MHLMRGLAVFGKEVAWPSFYLLLMWKQKSKFFWLCNKFRTNSWWGQSRNPRFFHLFWQGIPYQFWNSCCWSTSFTKIYPLFFYPFLDHHNLTSSLTFTYILSSFLEKIRVMLHQFRFSYHCILLGGYLLYAITYLCQKCCSLSSIIILIKIDKIFSISLSNASIV